MIVVFDSSNHVMHKNLRPVNLCMYVSIVDTNLPPTPNPPQKKNSSGRANDVMSMLVTPTSSC